jgi:hypothetical protein
MTDRESAQAELFARSAHYAHSMGNGKLCDTFTRRGIEAAGDDWPAVYGRATGEMAPEPTATTTRKGE